MATVCGRGKARKNSATCSRFLQAILRKAISPQQRQYVQTVIVSLCKSIPMHQWCDKVIGDILNISM